MGGEEEGKLESGDVSAAGVSEGSKRCGTAEGDRFL